MLGIAQGSGISGDSKSLSANFIRRGTREPLIPDPLCFGAVRSYQMQWIWDQGTLE